MGADQSSFAYLYSLYGTGWSPRLRTVQRWFFGTPFEYVETFVPRSGHIVDLGCGIGMFANLLAWKSPARQVYGVDLDEQKIGHARSAAKNRPNIRFLATRIEDFALPVVDAVVLYDVAHHLEPATQVEILTAVFRKLRSGGVVILKENDLYPVWKVWIARLVEWVAMGLRITLGAPHVHFRSQAEWKDLLQGAGFHVEHVEHIRTRYGFFVPHSLFVAVKLDPVSRL